jgi:ABC-type transport system involved in multi-copper enzyme maturation permease subunit
MSAPTTLGSPAGEPVEAGPAENVRRGHLVRAELLKIFTTNSWWVFAIFTLGVTALTLLVNLFQANGELANAEHYAQNPPNFAAMPPDERPTAAQQRLILEDFERSTDIPRILASSAANVYTSGQLLTLMFLVILGALIVTNEFFHQTATATFLTVPRRSRVILAKLGAAVILAAGFWAAITAIDIGVGVLNFNAQGYGIPFADATVIRAVLMNLLAFVIWAVLGVGLGVLIRSQLGATITGAVMYLVSWPVAAALFALLRTYVVKDDSIYNLVVVFPGVASSIMVAAEPVSVTFTVDAPPWWVGALVLLGYGVAAGLVGTLITRRRDIS